MQLNISGHHIEMTEALKSYVEEKISKVKRHFDNITNAQVTLTVEKERQKAEATIHLSGHEIHGSAEHEDMYAAIDLLSDKLDRQVVKYKEKTQARKQGAH